MAITLPDLPRGTTVDFSLVAAGGKLTSSLGGPTQALLRFGDRMQATFRLPKLDAPCARAWLAVKMQSEATGEVVRCAVPQLGAPPASPDGAGAAGSTAATVDGEVGQLFSFAAGGHGYLHMKTTGGVAPRLRAALAGSVSMDPPIIEGFLDQSPGWTMERLRFLGLEFSITEAR